jgi:hypothetical protein
MLSDFLIVSTETAGCFWLFQYLVAPVPKQRVVSAPKAAQGDLFLSGHPFVFRRDQFPVFARKDTGAERVIDDSDFCVSLDLGFRCSKAPGGCGLVFLGSFVSSCISCLVAPLATVARAPEEEYLYLLGS